ncbi:MAG: AMP-binding protein [Candidatus Rokubacteria bacterium]|nr:AMP-binding protein [Candidatus Rokubacteria bacterium]
MTLAAGLDRWACAQPDKLPAVDGERRYTWSTLARAVEGVAHGLAAHGVETGSVVSVQLPNWNEFLVVALAAERLALLSHGSER